MPHCRPAAALVLGLVALGVGPSAGAEERITVPSGQEVIFHEMLSDTRGAAGLTYRFRFIAPEIAREGGSIGFEEAAADMDHLCHDFALPRIAESGPKPRQVVISLADRPLRFGETMPDATQFFEAYRPENGTCIWEGL